mgnify:CR=1 FL=1
MVVACGSARTAVVNVYTDAETPFAAAVTTESGTALMEVDGATLFRNMAGAILDFFEAGSERIDRAESLTVRAILDAAGRKSAASRWTPLATRPR